MSGSISKIQPTDRSPCLRRLRGGATLADVLVALAVLMLAVAALAPIVGRAHRDSGVVVSENNLTVLAFGHALYGWDWDDRQVQWVPDDVGAYGGSCTNYVNQVGCPPQLLLGWDDAPEPTLWGYFLGCGGFPGTPCATWIAYWPNAWSGSTTGTFRLMNAKAFHDYVGGRFYDPTFYAPNDALTWAQASPHFPLPAEFDSFTGSDIAFSSYCLSPAAMWSPDVLRPVADGGFQIPATLVDGFTSPTVSSAAYPDLKTRALEHNWNQSPPAKSNPAFSAPTPYFFNHGIRSTPLALFFDFHIAAMPIAQTVKDDLQVLRQTRGVDGLWSRDTPLGRNGYYGAQSFDGTLASPHILTTSGILGRDVLTPQ